MNSGKHEGDPSVEQLNRSATDGILEQAERERDSVVALVHRAVVLFAQRDQRSLAEAQPGDTINLYVLQDTIAGPQGDDRSMLSLLFKHDESLSLPDRQDQLVVYSPVDTDDPFSVMAFDELPKPDEVFIERTSESGTMARYVVSHAGIEAYISPSDDGEGGSELDAFDERLDAMLQRRVDTGLPFVSQLHEDLINMQVVPQREITFGMTWRRGPSS